MGIYIIIAAILIMAGAGYLVMSKKDIRALQKWTPDPNLKAALIAANPKWHDKTYFAVVQAFRDYMSLFLVSNFKLELGIPSFAVLAVLKELKKNPADYQAFCKTYLGKEIILTPLTSSQAMSAYDVSKNTEFGRTLVNTFTTLKMAGEDYQKYFRPQKCPINHNIPLLFTVDDLAGIDAGIKFNNESYQALTSQALRAKQSGLAKHDSVKGTAGSGHV